MADQQARLEAATLKAETGSGIVYRFSNDAASEDDIPTLSGAIPNLKNVILRIQNEGADKISFATKIFIDTAAGIAGTSNQEIFLVQSADPNEIYEVWQNVSGTAVDTGKRSISAAAVIEATEAATAAAASAQESADAATIRVARFLEPSETPPTQRDDGQSLEIGDRYLNTSDQIEYIYKSSGWVANNLDAQELEKPSGASLSGWRRNSLISQIKNVAGGLDATSISHWEFENLITEKPNPAVPSTWNWAPAIQAVVDATPEGGTVNLRGLTGISSRVLISKPLTIINAKLEAHASTDTAVIHIVGTEDVNVSRVHVRVDYPAKTFASANVSGIQSDNSKRVKVEDCNGIGSKNEDYAGGSWGCVIHGFNSPDMTILRCTARLAHKEGIMTRECASPTISFCKAYDCGFSGIGTSRGVNPKVLFCESYRSGASNITVNGSGGLVVGNWSEGNLTQNGITVGHSLNLPASSGNSQVYGNKVFNSGGWGMVCAEPINADIFDNLIDGCVSGGFFSFASDVPAPDAIIKVHGNTIRNVGSHGIRNGARQNIEVYDNTITDTAPGMHGIYLSNGTVVTVKNNHFKNIGGKNIFTECVIDAEAHVEYIDNTGDGCGLSAMALYGGTSLVARGNNMRGFNNTASAAETGILLQPSAAGHATDVCLDDCFLQGTIGGTTASNVYITGTPSGAASKSLRVTRNRFPQGAVILGGAPSNFGKIHLDDCQIGSGERELSITVAAGAAQAVSNSNMQALGNWPSMIPLNQYWGGVYVETYGNGKLTLRNIGSSAATARLVW